MKKKLKKNDLRSKHNQDELLVSVCLIARNEEKYIEQCLRSVKRVADEIILVDTGSTDRTVELAKQYTDKIVYREFRGYKDKHEYSDSMTTGDWILWMDADERVTPELRASIEALRQRDPATMPDGFWISRKTNFLGRWVLHSGWFPDFQMRLYRKAASYWDGVAPHEVAHVRGRTEKLPGLLLHYTADDLSDYHRRVLTYATLSAEHLVKKGKSASGTEIFILPIAAFLRSYLIKRGFLDGIQGLIIAGFTAYGVFLRYAKVWEAGQDSKAPR